MLTAEEIGLQIMCSAWPRRLWTLQEGLFQSRVHYQFEDGVHTYESLNSRVRQLHCFPWRDIPLPSDHFLYEVLKNPPNLDRKSEAVFHSRPPLRLHAHKALTCWPVISSFFKDMNVLYHWQGVNNNAYLSKVIRSVMNRTTSKTEDEGLVFSSVLTVRSGSGAKMENVDPEDRLRKALQPTFGYSNVPGNIIFLDQQRYDQEGCRWIPKSFLSQKSPSTTLFLPETEEDDRAQSWPDGLHVKYPGLLLCLPESSSSIPQQFSLQISGRIYQACVYEAGTRDFPSDLLMARPPLLHPALILEHLIKFKASGFFAVLVDIIDWEDVQSLLSHGKVVSSTKKTMKGGFLALKSKIGNTVWGFRARHRALVRLTTLHDETWRYKLPFISTQPIACPQSRTSDLVWNSQPWFLV